MKVVAKKLIEVALPLEAINKASAREKSIRHGHPSTIHLWWARRPLAAARAVIFAQMVDDPSAHPDIFTTEKAQEKERQRLFRIIEDLVQWENTTNEVVLEQARAEIWQSWCAACAENVDHPRAKELFNRHKLPAFHDPFAGGGALPLEAQRLGLEAYASDLNPVAVLINKALIEIPPKFAGKPPVNPESRKDKELFKKVWRGAEGLAEDVRYYGQWMRDEAQKRIGELYPKIEITAEMAKERPDLEKYVGQKLTVIAWIWARTVKSPNPAFRQVDVPLASTFMLSTKLGKEAYVEPVIKDGGYDFTVKAGRPKNEDAAKQGTSAGRWNAFRCIMSGVPVTYDYIRGEGIGGRMGSRLMAVVVEGARGRVYLPPTITMEVSARAAKPWWIPDLEINYHPRDIKTQIYGLTRYGDLFTPRQLVALDTFSDLVEEVRKRVRQDGLDAGLSDSDKSLAVGGTGATAYGDAVGMYLGLLVDQQSNQSSTICGWNNINQQMIVTFSRQAIPMVWDFAECNVFSTSTGSFWNLLERQVKGIASLSLGECKGEAFQCDARIQKESSGKVVATDPPTTTTLATLTCQISFTFGCATR